jgi:mono/diheme cytochrome c family protein
MSARRRTLLLLLAALLLPACRQEMADQPAYRPFQPSAFFEDKQSARPLVPGTVARGHLQTDMHFYHGQKAHTNRWMYTVGMVGSANPLGTIPLIQFGDPLENRFPLKQVAAKLLLKNQTGKSAWEGVLQRGQERFTIFCAMCHDQVGTGKGMIVQRGYAKPPSLHEPRLRDATHGYMFQVITHGYGAMPSYAAQIPPEDRWAIIAYVRALQLSQNALPGDVETILKAAPDAATERKKIPGNILERIQGGK